MLSFIDQNTCGELADGVVRSACEYAAANPLLALGLTTGTLIAGTVGGLFWRHRASATPAVNAVPVARLKRQTVSEAITDTAIDQSQIVAPKTLSAEDKMSINLIVLAELNRQLQEPKTAEVARQLLVLRQTKRKEIDGLILAQLGYAEDGKKKTTLKM